MTEATEPDTAAAPRLPPRWAFFSAAVVALLAAAIWLRATAPALAPAASSVPPSSVVVLPFAPIGPHIEGRAMGIGLGDVVSGILGGVSGLRVGGYASATVLHQRGDSVRVIGREMGAGSVLAGTVRLAANQVRLAVRLVSVDEGFDLWSDVYEVSLAELPAVPQRIAAGVVEALRSRGGISQTLAAEGAPTGNAEAFHQYLLARAAPRPDGALPHLLRAVELDTGFAAAHAALARTYAALLGVDSLPPAELMPRARAAAAAALALDSTLAGPYVTLGVVDFLYERDWDAAARQLRRAADYNPSLTDAHLWYARYLLAMGRTEEAMVAARRARALDPVDLEVRLYFAWHGLFTREYDDARSVVNEVATLFPRAWEPFYLRGLIDQAAGDTAGALMHLAEAEQRTPTQIESLAALGWTHAMAGNEDEARRILVDLRTLSRERYVSPVLIAYIHAALGERRAAFAWLERGIREHAAALVYLRNDPRADPLRGDQKYPVLLRRIGLSRS